MMKTTYFPLNEVYTPKTELQKSIDMSQLGVELTNINVKDNGRQFTYKISLTTGTEWSYLTGHQINGNVTFPSSGYLYLVWNALATYRNVKVDELPIKFEDVQFSLPVVLKQSIVEMIVRFYEPEYNRFEVVCDGKVIVSGRVYVPEGITTIGWQEHHQNTWISTSGTDLLERDEIYTELKLRGYEFTNTFQSIYKANIDGTRGETLWVGKWVPFLEAIIQMHVLSKTGLRYPSYIQSIRIDPRIHVTHIPRLTRSGIHKKQLKMNVQYNGEFEYPVLNITIPILYDEYTRTYVSGGVEMSGFYSKPLQKWSIDQQVVLERYNFVPYFERNHEQCIRHFDGKEIKMSMEYIETYINQVEVYITEILRKVEFAKFFNTTSNNDIITNIIFAIPKPTTSIELNGEIVEGKFLNVLREICNYKVDTQFLDRVRQVLGDSFSFYKLWNEDPIFYITSGRITHLKTILDTVYENCTFDKPCVKVLEIGSQLNFFGPNVVKLMCMNPSAKVDYHYLPVGDFHPDFFNEWKSQYPMTKVEWDLRTQEIPAQWRNFDLIIMNGSLSYLPFSQDKKVLKSWLRTVSEMMLKPQGFILVQEYVKRFELLNKISKLERVVLDGTTDEYEPCNYQLENEWRSVFDDLLYPVSLKHDSIISTLCLYRKPYFRMLTRESKPYEIYIKDIESFDWIEKVKIALNENKYDRIWLICESVPTSGLIGFLRCLRREQGGDCLRCVFIHDQLPMQDTWRSKFDNIKVGDLVMNVFKNGKWGSYRHLFDYQEIEKPFIQKTSGNKYVGWLESGDISTLEWIQTPEPYTTSNKFPIVDVMFYGLNYRDYLVASGIVNPENLPIYSKCEERLFGMEFSGSYCDKRWMGITPSTGFSKRLLTDKKYIWEIPQQWSYEQAATIPFAYSQAYYSLIVRGGLKRNESILIHSGATPYGQAAISIALSYECKVFTTFETKEEREYLMRTFPGKLTEESFVYQNDEFFDRHILRHTQGKGVNVVINWFINERFTQSFRSLASCGRFLEISYFIEPTQMINTPFIGRNISFHSIFFESLFESENCDDWQRVFTLVQEGIRTGIVRPIKSIVYGHHQIKCAFKTFVESKSLDKFLVKVTSETFEKLVNVVPKVWFMPCCSYIITAGLSVLGLELCQWMVERGARKIILTSHTDIRTGYQQRKLKLLQETYGATIVVSRYDVREERDCILLIKEAIELSEEKKIGGIFHLETEFESGLIGVLSEEKYERVMDSKYFSAYYLDRCTRNMDCHFVVFSSITSGFGFPGSSISGLVNSSVEQLCDLRRKSGKQATVIQWGPIGEVDSVFGTVDTEIIYNGTVPHKIRSIFKVLEYVMLRSEENTTWTCYVPKIKRTSQFYEKCEQTVDFHPTTYTKYFENQFYPTIQCSTIGLRELEQQKEEFRFDSIKLDQEFRDRMTLNFEEPREEILRLIRSMRPQIYQKPTTYVPIIPKDTFFKLNDVEMKPKMTPVFIIHPIEGHVEMLKELGKQMKHPVYGIQFTNEALTQCDSIEELAEFYHQKIENLFGKSTVYHLIGYSFGSIVAYEMTKKFTTRVSSITCLNGSYKYSDEFLRRKDLSFQLLPVIETELLYRFILKFTKNVDFRQFYKQVIGLESYEHREQYTIKYLIDTIGITICEYELTQSCRLYVKLMLMAFSYNYTPKYPLNRDVLLVRPTKSTIFSEVFGADYGLNNMFHGKTRVELVEGEELEFLQPKNITRIATYLNDYISERDYYY